MYRTKNRNIARRRLMIQVPFSVNVHYKKEKMKQLCLYIILFSGLVCVGVCKPREYILIKQLKTWTKAQAYCRLNHYDLATVQTDEDLTNLRQTASEDGMISAGWIGFYNDINTWRWSHQDESVIYSNWYSLGLTMKCASIYPNGYWYELNCANSYEFMCSDDKNGTEKYYPVNKVMTWSNAREYCRNHYTDLVTIRNETENKKLSALVSSYAWIGCFRNWMWSDGSSLSSSNEASAQKLNEANGNCATSTYDGYFGAASCSSTFYFYCNTVMAKRQFVKVQVKSKDDMDDAQLQTLVMKKLQQTLSADDNLKIKWRNQENGNVFQKQIDPPECANGSSVCETTSL